MNIEEALTVAAAGDQTVNNPLSVLAAEVRRLRAIHERLKNHDGAILIQTHEKGRGTRYEALSLKYPNWSTQPARALGVTYSAWGGVPGHEYMEIHWPDTHPLQLILRPDEGELFGFIKIEQDAVNHWRLRRS